MSHKSFPLINHTKSAWLPEEGACINIQIFKRSTKAPFIIYGEAVLIPLTDNIDFGPNSKKY